MKKLLIILVLGIIFCITQVPTFAEDGRFGVWFILGDPTGLTGKYRLNNVNSIQLLVGWKEDGDFHLIGDYTFTWRNLIQPSGNLVFPVHLGGGVHIFNDAKKDDNNPNTDDDEDKFRLGPRFIAGIGIEIQRFEVYAEVGLGLFILPETDGNFTGGVGVRFYF